MDDDVIDGLIADLYHLATGGPDPAAWTDLMQRICSLAGAQRGVIQAGNPAQGRTRILASTDMPEDVQRDYAAYYCTRDLYLLPYTSLRPNETLLSQDYVAESLLERSEIYNDLLRPRLEDSFYNGGIFGALNQDDLLFMGLQRSRGTGPYDPQQAARLQRIWPHLRLSLQVAQRLHQAEAQAGMGFAALDALAGGVMVLEADRRVLFANRAAERLLRQASGVILRAADSRLRLLQPRTDAALAALVARAARPDPGQEAATMRCPRPDGLPPLSLLAVPFQPQRRLGQPVASPQVLLLIADPLDQPADLPRQLATLFSLSKAEAEVGAALAAGLSPEEIARERSVRLTTIRSQVKSLMAKTETRRQGELLRLLHSLPRTAPAEEK